MLHRCLIGFALTLLFAFLQATPPESLALIENKLLDMRFKLRGVTPAGSDVVIVTIDEKSIQSIGRWSWDRDVFAELLYTLTDAEPSVIAFDVIFSEPATHDPELAKAIDYAGNVLLPVVFDFTGELGAGQGGEDLDPFALRLIDNPEAFRTYQPIAANYVLQPRPELADMSMGLGHINMHPDNDGILRWELMLIAHEGRLVPSITLLAAAMHKGVGLDHIRVDAARNISLADQVVPTDHFGRMLIPYYGPSKTFPHYSIADVLNGNIPDDALANKVVLIGATAVGIYDLRVTPFAAAMPGVEKHASVISSILEGKTLSRTSLWIETLLLVGSGLLLTILLRRTGAIASLLISVCFGAMISTLSLLVFIQGQTWLNLSAPLLNYAAIYTAVMAYSFRVEERSSKYIRSLFSSYVTERVVNELIHRPELARLGGDRREVTVLFSDIKGFTSFSEKHSPQEVVSLLNEYLTAMTDVIFRWEGTLDKFVGDEIMVFWGAPLPQADHAERALRCALEMRQRLVELQQKWHEQGLEELDAGIGINSGEVLVGNIGAEGKKMDYTIIGDHVNLGARVEALTRNYATPILVTGQAIEAMQKASDGQSPADLFLEEIDKVLVKGREEPVKVYSLKQNEPQ
jgi:adenylate cyclase